MPSLLDKQTRASNETNKLNLIIDKTQLAPPLAKRTPLKVLKPSLQDSRIASSSINDYELLLQNDKVGIRNRKKSQTPKIMTKLENDMVKEFELDKPTGFETTDPLTGEKIQRRYNTEGVEPPNLDNDPSGIIPAYYDKIISDAEISYALQGIINEREQDLKVYSHYTDVIHKIETEIENLKDALNNAPTMLKPSIREQLRSREDDLNRAKRRQIRISESIASRYSNLREKIYSDAQEHNALVSQKKQRNLDAIKQYEVQLNLLNSGAFNTSKMINETEEEYLDRLRQNAEEIIPEDQISMANSKVLIEFRKRLQEITKDPVKIDQISNSIDVDDKYKLIKIWNVVKNKYNQAYGLTNKVVDAETIISFLNALLYKEDNNEALPSAIQDIISNVRQGAEPIMEGELIITPIIPENTIMLQKSNIANQPELYLRVVTIHTRGEHGNYALLYSFNGEVGTYKQFFPTHQIGVPSDRKLNAEGKQSNRGGKSDDEIKNKTGITTKDLNKLVGYEQSTFNPSVFAKKLATKYRLTPYAVADTTQKQFATYAGRKPEYTEYGMGIPKSQEPKLVPFGNIMLSLPNLKYKNILAIRTHNNKTIGGLPNVKISAKLTSILLNLIEHIQPTHEEINRLTPQERHIYDRVVYLGRLHKSIPNTNDKSIAELKKRLSLLEGEINIGNNSPQISTEIKSILKSLKDFHVITQKQIKEYITKNAI